jgi:toxin ParE1/3/4
MSLRLSPEAEADLDHIWLYVAQRSGSMDIANRLIDKIVTGLWLLCKQPHIGRRRDNDLRPGLRTFPIDDYVIIYRIDGVDTFILHIARGSRDLDALLED